MYADVIVATDAPGLPQPFTYHVPAGLKAAVFEGACVVVPFASGEQIGYIVGLTETPPDVTEIKDLAAVVTDACALNAPLIALARWISDYYLAPMAQSVRAIVPEVMSSTISRTIRVLDADKISGSSPNQRKFVETLVSLGGEADWDLLKARLGSDKSAATLRQLKARGAVEVVHGLELPKARSLVVRGLELADESNFEGDLSRAPKQAAIVKELALSAGPVRQQELLSRIGSSYSPAKSLVEKGLVEKVGLKVRRKPYKLPSELSAELSPTEEQSAALVTVDSSIATLLYGITGSGKTEVYLQSIRRVLDRGGSCISLVPEISLTTHLMSAYIQRFGDKIAILHSRLSDGERHDEWRRIESGEARVVLGPRSAVFAPVSNLGLVVVDEEHEPSYKQDSSPRYNARLAAEERCRLEGASLIVGSATPSMETYYRALSGEFSLAPLSRRIDDRLLPKVELVDLREEFDRGNRSIFSERLESAVNERLSRGEQVILFVNRRGYASFVLCRTCGYSAKCDNCAVSLTLHSAERSLKCHHCNSTRPAPTICPNCGGPHIRQFGIGTERVQVEAEKAFPSARIIRMDSDTTGRKGSHAKLLDTFARGDADILIGTQMIAKGLDFPNVTLVGVISADIALHLPDFRAAERTFQLLTQVSGRAGRGEVPGEVIVQSFSPEHYAVDAASRHDFDGFYQQEIEFRKELAYPPFSRLVNIVSSDPVDGYPENALKELADRLRFHLPEEVDMLGPAPAPLSKLKGLYRAHLLIKDRQQTSDGLRELISTALDGLPCSVGRMTIDVDPLSML